MQLIASGHGNSSDSLVKSSRSPSSKDSLSTKDECVHHSFNTPAALNARVLRCMKLEALSNFTDFANSALARRCREIEREHGIDAEGKPLP